MPDITAALTATAAPVVYVANVATQPGETDGYDLQAHVDALRRHIGDGVVDHVLANADISRPLPAGAPVTRVMPSLSAGGGARAPRLVTADLASPAIPTHHDPARLAEAVMRLVKQPEK